MEFVRDSNGGPHIVQTHSFPLRGLW